MTATSMDPARLLGTPLGRKLAGAGYQAQRTGLAALSAAFMRVFHLLLRPRSGLPPADQRAAVQRRFRALLERDLANAVAGYYPPRALFRTGLRDYLRVLPTGVRDLPRVLRRARRGGFAELPAEAARDRYPRYYRRTFHWQTDGWLSERSARLYDPGVELLFGGTADIMRRMVVPDLIDALADHPAPRVLDIACGTGRFLRQLNEAMPRARLYGLDLSPHYLKHAREHCASVVDLSLVAENAEAMPFADGFFDAAACVFLFHELPKDARRNVLAEAARVLAPGGLLCLVDSAQHDDAGEIRWFLDSFPDFYHEPYFKGYLRDPLEDAAADVGLEVVEVRPAFVSKIVVAKRPGGTA